MLDSVTETGDTITRTSSEISHGSRILFLCYSIHIKRERFRRRMWPSAKPCLPAPSKSGFSLYWNRIDECESMTICYRSTAPSAGICLRRDRTEKIYTFISPIHPVQQKSPKKRITSNTSKTRGMNSAENHFEHSGFAAGSSGGFCGKTGSESLDHFLEALVNYKRKTLGFDITFRV